MIICCTTLSFIYCMYLNLFSLNCTGLINQVNRSYIHETLVKHNADVVFLQETWLSEKNDGCLSDIHEDYLYCSQSSMNTRNTIITGRPYGGVAILWKKSLGHCIQPVKTANSRICAVTMNMKNITFLFVCLYLPCDTGSRSVLNEDYVSCLNYVQELVELHNVHGLVIGGDFNTDLNRNTCQTKYLTQYIDKLCLKSVWEHKKAIVQPTFESYCGRHVSVIDYFVCSINLFSKVVKAFVSKRLCFGTWIQNGRPHEGWVAKIRRQTRASYHKAIKDLGNKEHTLRRARMGELISNSCGRDLCRELAKVKLLKNNKVSNLRRLK